MDTYRRRRGEMAAQLHGVMEAQWRQALRILTSGVAASATHGGAGGSGGFHTGVDCGEWGIFRIFLSFEFILFAFIQ